MSPKLIYIAFALMLFACLLGIVGTYQSIEATEQRNTKDIPELSAFSSNDWESTISQFAQFAPNEAQKAEAQDTPTDPSITVVETGIKQAQLVGIFIDQVPSAIIMSTDKNGSQAKRFTQGERFDAQWRLASINSTYITWLNDSTDDTFIMRLFEPTRSETENNDN